MEASIEKSIFNIAIKAFKKLAKSDRVTFRVNNGVFSIISNGLTYFKYNIHAEDTVDGIITIPASIFEKLSNVRDKNIRFTTSKNKLIVDAGSKFELYSLTTDKEELKSPYTSKDISINPKGVLILKNILQSLHFSSINIDYKGIPVRVINDGKFLKLYCADYIHFVSIKTKAVSKQKFKFDTDLKYFLSIFNFIDGEASIQVCNSAVMVLSETIITNSPKLTVGTGSIDDAIPIVTNTDNFQSKKFVFDKNEIISIIDSASIVSEHSDVMVLKLNGSKAKLFFNTKHGKSSDTISLINNDHKKYKIELPFFIFKDLLSTNTGEIAIKVSKDEKMYSMCSKTKNLSINCVGPLC